MSAPKPSAPVTGAGQEFYLSLEILRGICAFQVFVWHVFVHIHRSLLGPWGLGDVATFMHKTSEASILTFFAISGFVTTHSFFHYFRKDGETKAPLLFLSARYLRIWSVSIPVALACYGLTVHYRWSTGDMSPWNRFRNPDALLRSALAYSREWNAPGWTLPYEMFAYSLLPAVLMMIFCRSVWLRTAGAGLLGFSLWFHFSYMNFSAANSMKPMLACFAGGSVIYFGREWFKRQHGAPLALTGMAMLISIVNIESTPYSHWLPKAIAAMAIIAGMVAITPRPGRVVTVLTAVGAASYSLYLWHWPVIWFGNLYFGGKVYAYSPLGVAFLLLVLIPLIGVITFCSYYFIERHSKLSAIRRRIGMREPGLKSLPTPPIR